MAVSGFCRDCGRDNAAGATRCRHCHSPRLIAHPELDRLTIAHIDCDAFYAAVEKRDRPELKDKPVIVGGGHRGVVSTACYIARLSGVRSAMPMFRARKLCPDAVVLPPDIKRYAAISEEIRKKMLALTPLVEPLSIDEAFLDLSGTENLRGLSPARALAGLAREIETEIGISVSIGLSHNKFLAKIASDLDKPRGFSIIGEAETLAFLAEKPVGLIWGVGKVMREHLAKDGIFMIGQLQRMELGPLVRRYGQMGDHLWHLARGLDHRKVEPEAETKSISAETTFDEDIADAELLAEELWPLAERVSARTKKAGLSGQVVHLKLKSAGFRLISRQTRLADPTQMAETIYRAALGLLRKEAKGEWYRLIGIGIGNLEDAEGADPIDLADPDSERRRRIEAVIDDLRAKHGAAAIMKGRSLKKPRRK